MTTTRFITLFEGRTGSSLLGDLLNQNPDVTCLGEEVAHLRHDGWPAQLDWMQRLFLDTTNFDDGRIKPTAKAIGFKVKLREISDPQALKTFIENNQVRVVHMHRENFIKQVVSSVRAMDLHKNTGRYNLKKGERELIPEAYPIPRRRFNTTLLWLLEAVHNLDLFVARLKTPVHFLTYEQLCEDMEGGLNRLTDFLGASSGSAKVRLIKVTDDDLSKAVTNYNELRDFYSDSVFANMF